MFNKCESFIYVFIYLFIICLLVGLLMYLFMYVLFILISLYLFNRESYGLIVSFSYFMKCC